MNSGYGLGKVNALATIAATSGKVFIVAKTAAACADVLRQIYVPDNDGTIRYYTTIASAVAACTASRGDVVIIAEGHTESISSNSALTISTAGIRIVGLGTGSLRPTFTLDTATSARINITAANITFKNCIFVANFGDIVTCFLNNAGPEFQVVECEFRDTSSSLNFLAIVTTTVSVNADGLVFNSNRIQMKGTTAGTTPIKIAGTIDRVTINTNFVTKAVLNNTSCLLAHGALVVTNLEMDNNKIFSANTDSATGGFLITTSSTTNTGMVMNNKVQGLDTAAAILVTAGSKYGMFNNLYDGDADASGFVLPAIGAD